MAKYVLLRDNNESGPYSIKDLKALDLRPTDLIRSEGDHTNWKHPAEMEEFQLFVYSVSDHQTTNLYPSPLSPLSKMLSKAPADSSPSANTEPVEESKEKYEPYQETKIIWTSRLLQKKNTLNLVAVFVGLIISVFVVKKMVDGLVEETFEIPTPAAIPIITPHDKIADKEYQNALVTEIIPSKKTQKFFKPPKPKDIKKQIKLTGSHYTVGFFGGINGVELKVSNTSPHFVNQVEIELNYLEQNGEVIETDTYRIRGVKPNSSQTLMIPPNKRGVKVKYKIMNIYSRQYRSLFKIV